MFGNESFEEPVAPEQQEQDTEIAQEDAWAVISAFFEEKGLVRQQLDSFNEFVSNTMQEIVDESNEISVRPENQFNPGLERDDQEEKEFKIKFGQIYLGRPLVTEQDDETQSLFPKEARLRNLTCVWPSDGEQQLQGQIAVQRRCRCSRHACYAEGGPSPPARRGRQEPRKALRAGNARRAGLRGTWCRCSLTPHSWRRAGAGSTLPAICGPQQTAAARTRSSTG